MKTLPISDILVGSFDIIVGRCRIRSVGIATSYRQDGWGSIPDMGKTFFSISFG
jgi:hypothetical protein